MRSAQHPQETERGPKYETPSSYPNTIFTRVCANVWENHAQVIMPHSQMIREIETVALNKETVAVYLLDDDSSILKATRRLLDSAGWKVEAFTDPFAFLKRAAIERPDVAVIDILMPEMNGLEVQTRLHGASPSTRVVVLTSKDDPSVRRMAMDAGASAFFIKGVESGEFLAGVKAAADPGN
jgi:PleD family two-component response regulator